jgi:hypothetical protein
MKEVFGDLWSYENRKGFMICITTNGFIKKDGMGVMGAGVARQAVDRYPDLPRLLGMSLSTRGNRVSLLTAQILSFPVKRAWFQDAALDLIGKSCKGLAARAEAHPNIKYVLPRPGCGNGNLEWKKVKPILQKYFANLDNVYVIAKEEERECDGNGKGKGKRNGTRAVGKKVRTAGAGNLRSG